MLEERRTGGSRHYPSPLAHRSFGWYLIANPRYGCEEVYLLILIPCALRKITFLMTAAVIRLFLNRFGAATRHWRR